MKKNIVYLILATVCIFIVSCKDDFLQDGSISPDGSVTEQQFWNHPDWSRNFLNNIYNGLQIRYNVVDGAMLASGSDEAVNSALNGTINILNNGTWSPVRTVDDVYNNMYIGIRKCNIFLVKAPTSAIIPNDGLSFQADVARMRGEAFFLRGYFLFELVKRY